MTACLQERAKRLKKEECIAATSKARADGAQHKCLASNAFEGRMLDVAGSLVVSAGDMSAPRGRLRKILGHGRVIKQHVANLGTILDSGKTVVWLVPDGFTEQVVTGHLASLPDELKSVCLVSRILGGFIANEEWVAASEEVHPILNQVPQPIACLEAAAKTSREIVIDEAVAEWAKRALVFGNGITNPASKWIVRPDRKVIKNDLQAFVLFGSAEEVDQDAEKKKKVKDKILRRRAALAACTTAAAKVKAKAKLVPAVATGKTFRGKGLALESFATAIANFV